MEVNGSFTPRETDPVPIGYEAACGPRRRSGGGLEAIEKNVTPGWNILWPLRSYSVTVPHGVFLLPGNTSSANISFLLTVSESRPPLWSSSQSSWLHNGDVLCFL
jgi:hypothetical protein